MSDSHCIVDYREVAGYPNYRIGSDGTVWSRNRIVAKRTEFREDLGPEWHRIFGRITRYGYCQVRLWKANKENHAFVHRLVLEAFVGPCPDGMECCHNDGDKLNCRLENLRWDTRSGNINDRYKHGQANRGEGNSNAKMTADNVRELRRDYRPGYGNLIKFARKFGVTNATAFHALHGQSWAWLDKEEP